jgi:hypothetical protein
MIKNQIRIEEFKSLREEMLKWQERRFEVLKIALLTSSAIVTGSIAKSDAWESSLAIAAVLFVLGISARLIRLFATFTAAGGSYLEVFFDSEWEKRNRLRLSMRYSNKELSSIPTLNQTFTWVLFGIALVSAVVCYSLAKKPSLFSVFFVLVPAALFFLVNAYYLYNKSYPRKELVDRWLALSGTEIGEFLKFNNYQMSRRM